MAKKTSRRATDEPHESHEAIQTESKTNTITAETNADDPMSIIDALTRDSASSYTIIGYRLNERGERVGIGQVSLEDFDQVAIAEHWGGGRFRFQARDAKGRVVRTWSYEHAKVTPKTAAPRVVIDETRVGSDFLRRSRDGFGPDERGDSGHAGIGALVSRFDELARRVEQASRPAETLSLRDLLPILRPQEPIGIRELLPLIVDREKTPLMDIITAMSALRGEADALRGSGGGKPSKRDESLGELAREIWPFLRELLTQPPTAPRQPAPNALPGKPPPRPATPTLQATPEQEALELTRGVLQRLIRKPDAAIDFEGYASVLLDILGERAVIDLLRGETPEAIAAALVMQVPEAKDRVPTLIKLVEEVGDAIGMVIQNGTFDAPPAEHSGEESGHHE